VLFGSRARGKGCRTSGPLKERNKERKIGKLLMGTQRRFVNGRTLLATETFLLAAARRLLGGLAGL
jgi:hypothetical protein